MSFATSKIIRSVLCAVVIAAALAVTFRPPLYAPYYEGGEYAAIARGDNAQLHSYYAGRVLHPWAVRGLAQILRREPDSAVFRLMSEVSLVSIFVLLGIYYAKEGCSWAVMLFVASPILIDAYRNYYWADLFYIALWLVFFLLLRRSVWLSLPLVVALYLTRESTMMLVLSLVIMALVHRRKLLAVSELFVGLVGMWLVSLRTSSALPNTHRVPVWQLDLLKVPFNFALNILGISLWTNTIASTTAAPTKSVTLPSFLRVGAIVQVGFIDWNWTRPGALVILLACAFGMLPVITLRYLRAQTIKNERYDQAVALLFGAFMLVLTPLSGTAPARYILYAAPLFWIASARWMRDWSSRQIFPLAGISLAVSWFPVLVRRRQRICGVNQPLTNQTHSCVRESRFGHIGLARLFRCKSCWAKHRDYHLPGQVPAPLTDFPFALL